MNHPSHCPTLLRRLLSVPALLVLLLLAAPQVASAAMSDGDFLDLCGSGTVQQVRQAVQAGANVNAKEEDGDTVLMGAQKRWQDDPAREPIIRLLQQAGAKE